MTTLPDRLRSIYVAEGANYVQEAAREIERLTAELANARAADIHSCHDNCTRDDCVNARLREKLELAEVVRASQVEGLTAGIDRMREDALRYRYLRDVAWHAGSLIFYAERYGPEDWDEHIDAALAARKGEV